MQSFPLTQEAAGRGQRRDGWTLHDLRRTGRTVMGNLEVDDSHGRREFGSCLRRQHDADLHMAKYRKPKRDALVALEQEVLRIVEPPPADAGDNVVAMRKVA